MDTSDTKETAAEPPRWEERMTQGEFLGYLLDRLRLVHGDDLAQPWMQRLERIARSQLKDEEDARAGREPDRRPPLRVRVIRLGRDFQII